MSAGMPGVPPRGPEMAASHPQGVLDLIPEPRKSFDNFIVGDNAELVALLRGDRRDGDRFVYLWGGEGSGRTHLLRAALGVLADGSAPAARYMDLRAPDAPLGIELLADATGRPVDRLALDNVDALDAGGEQRLFNLYNTVRQERPGCMLLVSGPRPPATLGLRADLVTRLSWGLTYEVHPLTDAQKSAAMARHAQSRGVVIGGEVIDWLLQTMPRDLPTLLAVIDSLDRHSLAAKRAITLPLAREWLRSLGG
jgi:DnaA family protein